ncbi:hypothetical protein QFZ37_000949 [Chryseobacterium ginsenosidimutans]|uniref:hypothetical protein n=1 Tax=Chryseobacterium ginsenosidimutans TaxID=687846 RepID=UPI00277E5D8F|nr:hypothetical protein [Chryseobacterium ginsenosidimutans]MDQ0592580.1 hypothetical protein [Chryseobacterium ginsenosidimutans]
MDFNIVKIGGFIVLVLVYLTVKKLFKRFADFTENIGKLTNTEEMEIEIEKLNTKIITLEQQINNKP